MPYLIWTRLPLFRGLTHTFRRRRTAAGTPFGQWRLYEVGRPEAAALQRLKLRADYEEARKRLGAVLYRARTGAYFGLPKLKPMFSIRPRSAASLKKDAAEREAVMNSVGLR